MALAAYFYPATKAQKARGLVGSCEIHEISGDNRRTIRARHPVEGKREAAKVAAAHGATPWNW